MKSPLQLITILYHLKIKSQNMVDFSERKENEVEALPKQYGFHAIR